MRPSSALQRDPQDARRAGMRWFVRGALGGILACGCGDTRDTIALPAADTRVSVADCSVATASAAGVVALYTFDGDEGETRVTDSVGGHDAMVQLGPTTTIDGPDGCGPAFAFGAEARYFVIEDSPDWDLDVGSLDFWLWLPPVSNDHAGVLSRDAVDRERRGHLSLFVDDEGRALVRVQPVEDGPDEFDDAVACSETPLPRERWVHLGVNFGPPEVELYVGGELQDWVGASSLSAEWRCGQRNAWGIAGNDLPWVVGRASFRDDDSRDEFEFPALDSAIDQLRISGVRRDFARLFGDRSTHLDATYRY